MQARIYKPAKTAMQSGEANTKHWVLEFAPQEQRELDPLMGWTSSGDTRRQVRIRFETKEAAKRYAEERGIDAVIIDPHKRRARIRPRGYGENFAHERREAWSH